MQKKTAPNFGAVLVSVNASLKNYSTTNFALFMKPFLLWCKFNHIAAFSGPSNSPWCPPTPRSSRSRWAAPRPRPPCRWCRWRWPRAATSSSSSFASDGVASSNFFIPETKNVALDSKNVLVFSQDKSKLITASFFLCKVGISYLIF